MKKVTIVGAGNVGSQAAFVIALKNLADVVLIDVVEGIPQGKALDILEAMPLFGSDAKVIGTNNYEDTKNSDIVVITAGIARKPGMTREQLVDINAKIVKEVTEQIIKYSQHCILIVVTNPLDAMVYVAYKTSQFPKHKVMGMAGILDSTRFATFVAQELHESVKNINCMVIGSHGEGMTSLVDHSFVNNTPLSKKFNEEKLHKIVDRVRNGGIEIVNYLKTGSAFFAPGAAIAEMVEAIIKDQKKQLPCTAYLEGEYDVHDIFLGVPIILGKNGVEKIVELHLNEQEKNEFLKNAENVKKQIDGLKI